MKEKYHNEKILRENLEESFEDSRVRVEQAENTAQQAVQELDKLKSSLEE